MKNQAFPRTLFFCTRKKCRFFSQLTHPVAQRAEHVVDCTSLNTALNARPKGAWERSLAATNCHLVVRSAPQPLLLHLWRSLSAVNRGAMPFGELPSCRVLKQGVWTECTETDATSGGDLFGVVPLARCVRVSGDCLTVRPHTVTTRACDPNHASVRTVVGQAQCAARCAAEAPTS